MRLFSSYDFNLISFVACDVMNNRTLQRILIRLSSLSRLTPPTVSQAVRFQGFSLFFNLKVKSPGKEFVRQGICVTYIYDI